MMYNCCVNVVHLNFQRSEGILCDVGRVMSEERVSVARLQELYVSFGSVSGLPSSWRVFKCVRGPSRAAVVVNDVAIKAM